MCVEGETEASFETSKVMVDDVGSTCPARSYCTSDCQNSRNPRALDVRNSCNGGPRFCGDMLI